jgi:hypothetical protein
VSEDPTQPSKELQALALFAEALADPTRRREVTNVLDLLETSGLRDEVSQGFIDLFDGLTPEEVRMLARLQRRMVALDPDGALGLTQQVPTNSHATIAKL